MFPSYSGVWRHAPERLLLIIVWQPRTELHSNFFVPVDRQLKSRNETSIAKLVAFYTELIRQWAITYGNQAQGIEFSQEESLALCKVLSHVGQICLVGLSVFFRSCSKRTESMLIRILELSGVKFDSRCDIMLLWRHLCATVGKRSFPYCSAPWSSGVLLRVLWWCYDTIEDLRHPLQVWVFSCVIVQLH